MALCKISDKNDANGIELYKKETPVIY